MCLCKCVKPNKKQIVWVLWLPRLGPHLIWKYQILDKNQIRLSHFAKTIRCVPFQSCNIDTAKVTLVVVAYPHTVGGDCPTLFSPLSDMSASPSPSGCILGRSCTTLCFLQSDPYPHAYSQTEAHLDPHTSLTQSLRDRERGRDCYFLAWNIGSMSLHSSHYGKQSCGD